MKEIAIIVVFVAVFFRLYQIYFTENLNSKFNSSDHVCILGAGPSGVISARRLQMKGYSNITIFEKDKIHGGKVQNLPVEGENFRMGAVWGIWPSYSKTVSLAKEFGLSFDKTVWNNKYVFETTSGTIEDLNNIPIEKLSLLYAALKYSIIRYYSYSKYLVPGYTKGIPQKLSVPISQFLEENGLTSLVPALYFLITGSVKLYFLYLPHLVKGYGSLNEIPAIYVLYHCDHFTLLSIMGMSEWFSFGMDFHTLFDRILDKSKVNVIYNSNIQKITRSVNGINILRSDQEHHCDHLIISFAPKLDSLKTLSLSNAERNLFSKVKTNHYFSSLINSTSIQPGIYFNNLGPRSHMKFLLMKPKGTGHPISLYRPLENFNLTVVYSWDSEKATSIKTIQSKLTSTASSVNRVDHNLFGTEKQVRLADVLKSYQWNYFPHVDSAAIQNGFFQSLNSLQGTSNTYWTGAIRSFENVERVIDSAIDLIDKYF